MAERVVLRLDKAPREIRNWRATERRWETSTGEIINSITEYPLEPREVYLGSFDYQTLVDPDNELDFIRVLKNFRAMYELDGGELIKLFKRSGVLCCPAQFYSKSNCVF